MKKLLVMLMVLGFGVSMASAAGHARQLKA